MSELEDTVASLKKWAQLMDDWFTKDPPAKPGETEKQAAWPWIQAVHERIKKSKPDGTTPARTDVKPPPAPPKFPPDTPAIP